MQGFKDIVAQDIRSVFLNLEEFADERTVRYDGEVYEDIPVVLTGPVEQERERLTDDHIQGLHLVTDTLYCARDDLGGKLPKQGKRIEINTRTGGNFFRTYYIAASADEAGMLHVELEAVAQ